MIMAKSNHGLSYKDLGNPRKFSGWQLSRAEL